MPSSISSSNQRLPKLQWRTIWLVALLVPMLFVLMLEARLALRGFLPTIVDSRTRWLEERSRVPNLGRNALVLIGGSRIQLGIDMQLLRKLTNQTPIQLAIDGNPYGPVLFGLANDPHFTGTVVIDYVPQSSLDAPSSLTAQYEEKYQQIKQSWISWDFERLEGPLEDRLRQSLRSYANGAMPFDSLTQRILTRASQSQYLKFNSDRSRDADYRKVIMPDFYFDRIMRELGDKAPIHEKHNSYQAWYQAFERKVGELKPVNNDGMERKTLLLEKAVAAITRRGGKVIFVVLPTSGLIRSIEQRSYPRELFWEPLVKTLPATMIHFEDVPELRNFNCPDGSHLDYRDKARFTAAFATSAGLIPASNSR